MKTKFSLPYPIFFFVVIFFIQCSHSVKKDGDKQETKSTVSEITCPKCGFKKTETLPTDVCVITYECTSCGYTMHPKDGDCCVFCTYGNHKCPSKQ